MRRNDDRLTGLVSGRSASMKNGVPYLCKDLSTAIERPGGSGMPWPPIVSVSSSNPRMRKNMIWQCCRPTSLAYSGWSCIHWRMRCGDASSRGIKWRSISTRPAGT
jgi:hypothetical protein